AVTHHAGVRCSHLELGEYLFQHPRVRLAGSLVGTAGHIEIVLQIMTGEHAIQPPAALAGGYRQIEPSSPQRLNRRVHTIEQRGAPSLRVQIAIGIGLDNPTNLRAPQLRVAPGHRVRQGQPSGATHLPDTAHRPLHIQGSALHGDDDVVDGVGQGAVPVEDQGVHCPTPDRPCRVRSHTSPGSARTLSRPPPGNSHSREAACKNNRLPPISLIILEKSSSPYFGSPAMGCPAWRACTRIWWVRPVMGRASTSVATSPKRCTTRNSVRDSLPSGLTSTMRSPERRLFFSKGACTFFRWDGQRPRTSAR